jgi:hypothetical protein
MLYTSGEEPNIFDIVELKSSDTAKNNIQFLVRKVNTNSIDVVYVYKHMIAEDKDVDSLSFVFVRNLNQKEFNGLNNHNYLNFSSTLLLILDPDLRN